MISKSTKNSINLLVVLFFVYVVLFEFILPFNNYFPKPSILIESFLQIWTVYNFHMALFSTAGLVYVSILSGYILVYYFRGLIIHKLITLKPTFESLKLFRYFPAIFFTVLFSIWFKGSLTAEFAFGIIASFLLIVFKVNELLSTVKDEHILLAHQLNPNRMFSEIYWKSILPQLIKYLMKVQYIIWTLVLMYEYITNSFGVGYIYRLGLTFNDLGAVICISIIMSLFVWAGNSILHLLEKKIVIWE